MLVFMLSFIVESFIVIGQKKKNKPISVFSFNTFSQQSRLIPTHSNNIISALLDEIEGYSSAIYDEF